MKRFLKTFFVFFTCFFVSFVPPLTNIAKAQEIDTSHQVAGLFDWLTGSSPTKEDAENASGKSSQGKQAVTDALGTGNLDKGSVTIGTNTCTTDWTGAIGSILGTITSGFGLLIANIAVSLLANAPFVGGAFEPFNDFLDSFNSVWTNALIWGIIGSFAIYIGVNLVNLALAINAGIDAASNPIIKTGFNITLGITNIFFIIILVVVGIMTILRRSGWSWQKRLGNLIIAIILVNFSIYIASLLINVSNVFTVAIAQNFCASDLFNSLHLGATYSILQKALGGDAFSSLITAPAAMIAAASITLIGALTVFALFIFLIIRYIVLILLLAIMPIAWIGFVAPEFKIPGVGNPWQKWWSEFIKWLVVGPVMAFSLYLTIATLKGLSTTSVTTTGLAGGLSGVLNIAAALIMSILGLYVAVKGSGFAGALIAGGLAAGTGWVAGKVGKLGEKAGFRQQAKLQDKAQDLRKQAEEAAKAGDNAKAMSLRTKAALAEKTAQKAFGSIGKGASMAAGGIVAGKALGIAKVKLPGSGGPASVEDWRSQTMKKAEERYKGMTDSEKADEMRKIDIEMNKGVFGGRKIELQNRYNALAQGYASSGKLSDDMIRKTLRTDFQQQARLMNKEIKYDETVGKKNAVEQAKMFSMVADEKIKEGYDSKAIGGLQRDIAIKLNDSKKLSELTRPQDIETVYNLKADIEKKKGTGSFEQFEIGMGMNTDNATKLFASQKALVAANAELSVHQQSVANMNAAGVSHTSREYTDAVAEVNRLNGEISNHQNDIKDQIKLNAEWVSKLDSKDVKNLPLNKIFGDASKPENNLFGGDQNTTNDLRKAVAEYIAKNAPQNAAQFLNVNSENYEQTAKQLYNELSTRLGTLTRGTNEFAANESAMKNIERAARKRGFSL